MGEHGRGLALVDALADDWGWEPEAGGGGKTVWFDLRADGAGAKAWGTAGPGPVSSG